jgi:NADPH:quinone reductase-like Zn-dependent oxidoreductase
MRAIRMHEFGGPEVLRLDEVPPPEPTAQQVRIRVRATGINPFDWKLREGRMRGRIDVRLPYTPGYDAVGTIDRVGAAVAGWKVGDEVLAALNRIPGGAYAEYAVASAQDVVRKPESMTFEAATACSRPQAPRGAS